MFETLSIFLREGVEMVLLLMIIIVYLERTNRKNKMRYVYSGASVAVLLSFLVAFILHSIKTEFSPIFEAVLAFITAALVLSVILWFHFGSKHITRGMDKRIEKNYSRFQNFGILFFTFLIIFREGVEIVLMMLTFEKTIGNAYIEAIIALFFVFLLGYFILKEGLKINIRKFFKITTIMLVVVFAELIIHGFFELAEQKILNFGNHIFIVMEFLIDGNGKMIFSLSLLVLIIVLLSHIFIDRYKMKRA